MMAITLLMLVLPLQVFGDEHLYDIVVDGCTYRFDQWSTDNTIHVTFMGPVNRDTTGVITVPETVVGKDGNNYTVTRLAGSYNANEGFTLCSNVTGINILAPIEIINDWSFEGCKSLVSISIPSTVHTIYSHAFWNCESLTSLHIPKSVTSIGYVYGSENYEGIGDGLSSLASITVESENPVYDSRDNCNAIIETATNTLLMGCNNTIIPNTVVNIGNGAFSYSKGLTSITIPNSVKTIGATAFSHTGLRSVVIPSSVTSIGNGAFRYCSLKQVQSNITEPFAIDDGVFENYSIPLYVPLGTKAKYEATDGWKKFTQIREVDPDSPVLVGTEFVVDGITYKVYSNVAPMEVQVGSGNSSNNPAIDKDMTGEVVIPSTVKDADGNEFAVTVIGDYAFYNTKVSKVVLPESLVKIGILSFAYSTITDIEIPNNVTELGVFGSCTKLKSITLSNSLKEIPSEAFHGCSSLTTIIIPKSVISIGSTPFRDCPMLTKITVEAGNTMYDSRNDCNAIIETASNTLIQGCNNTVIPNTVKIIADAAFYGSGIKNIVIPSSVESLGKYGYNILGDCSSLETIVVESGNTVFDSRNNCNALIRTDDNTLLSGCMNTIIPDGVTNIAYGAFFGCSQLEQITIPSSVKSIESGAFQDCSSLTSIDIPEGVTTINIQTFYGCSSLRTVTIPSTVTEIGDKAFSGTNNLASVICYIEEPFAINYNSIFSKYNSRVSTTLYVPEGTVEKYQSTDGWKDFSSIEVIGNYADDDLFTAFTKENVEMTFRVLDNDKKTCQVGSDLVASINVETSNQVTIPEIAKGYKVTAIGDRAFYNCRSLTHVWLHESIESIGDSAFYNCTSLRVVDIPRSVKRISSKAFINTPYVTLNIPYDHVDVLPADMVYNVKVNITQPKKKAELERVFIPKPVKTIGDRVFSNCKAVKAMVVDEENTTFDSRDNCNAIIRTSNNTLLYGCQNTVIPATVKAINNYAFEGHSNLKAITIPSEVTSIGQYAFYGCTSLTKVVTEILTPFAINDNTFSEETYQEATLYVPAGTKELYETTDGWKNFKKIVLSDVVVSEGDNDAVDFGEIGEDTDLNDNIVGNIYYNIAPENGSYDKEEGCIVVTKPTSDEQMCDLEDKNLTDEELKSMFTGIIIKVPAGKGNVMIEAETTGSMTLKVKIGNADPVEMELTGKLKVKIPYNVLEPTYVYIYGGKATAEARGRNKAAAEECLKLYGIEVEKTAVLGDVDGDGKVTVSDITIVANVITGIETDPVLKAAADVNNDGVVNVADIVFEVKLIMQ